MKLRVLILGHGRMGKAMEYLLDSRHELCIWDVEGVVQGSYRTLEQAAAAAQVVLFCLPVNPHYEIAARIAPHLAPGSLCLTIAKGLDEAGRTAAQVFASVFTAGQHYGVL
jgi:glycerol-3-phosphate dehydrogenase (NAD(P)+)